ncbi:MAG: TonB-dependent receptor [Candidatus Sulfopaludibacter sp.]|nr:TonB-dependent receptor [Candidatus Sulfopaludibacter sp.]
MRSLLGIACLLVLVAGAAAGQNSLADASLEQLLNTRVTSVSKREAKLGRSAAAVFVISAEDIRRSGAANLPDVLRMAPGVDVQQVDASIWAISIRGFNSRYSNKVLVMVDGRSIYTPTFAGVYWDNQDLPLEDIDRIEVIRGPGATLWGANAVNGVISILTKSAKATQGGLIAAGGGSNTRTLDTAQFGGKAGPAGAYRIYGRFLDVGNLAMPGGDPAYDRWSGVHGGFRSDWDLSPHDALMVEGDLFVNREHETVRSGWIPSASQTLVRQQFDSSGGSLLARWTHSPESGVQTSVQAYYDSYRRTEFGGAEKVRSFDVEFQQHVSLGSRQEIVWGLGYRGSPSSLTAGPALSLSPASRTDTLWSVFLEDEIRLTGSLSLTLGGRLEHGPYAGWEDEPGARLAWSPGSGRNTIWLSAAKADHLPSRTDTGIQVDLQSALVAPNVLQVVRLYGNPRLNDEEMRDYEAGYRARISDDLTADIATFLSCYRHLETYEPGTVSVTPGSPVLVMLPMTFENLSRGVDYGGEVSLNWTPAKRWRIRPSYSYLHATMSLEPSSHGATSASIATGFPQNQFQIHSWFNLSRKTEFDQSVYYTARLPGSSIPGHTRLDVRLARRIGENVEVSLVGQNLLRPRTLEFGDAESTIGTEALRSVFGRIAWSF